MESLEVTARTVNEAIAKALAQLGRERSEVDISVLSEGARGIFGIGGEDARILGLSTASAAGDRSRAERRSRRTCRRKPRRNRRGRDGAGNRRVAARADGHRGQR